MGYTTDNAIRSQFSGERQAIKVCNYGDVVLGCIVSSWQCVFCIAWHGMAFSWLHGLGMSWLDCTGGFRGESF